MIFNNDNKQKDKDKRIQIAIQRMKKDIEDMQNKGFSEESIMSAKSYLAILEKG